METDQTDHRNGRTNSTRKAKDGPSESHRRHLVSRIHRHLMARTSETVRLLAVRGTLAPTAEGVGDLGRNSPAADKHQPFMNHLGRAPVMTAQHTGHMNYELSRIMNHRFCSMRPEKHPDQVLQVALIPQATTARRRFNATSTTKPARTRNSSQNREHPGQRPMSLATDVRAERDDQGSTTGWKIKPLVRSSF